MNDQGCIEDVYSLRHASLAICIPTYKRPEALSRLLCSINRQQSIAPIDLTIDVIDNDPKRSAAPVFQGYYKGLSKKGWKARYKANDRNLGAECNIAKAYLAPRARQVRRNGYVWVVGDDDLLDDNAFAQLRELLSSSADFSWIITSRKLEVIERFDQVAGVYENYKSLLDRCSEDYPELPIHHTLISCNIVRHEIFDFNMWKATRGTRYPQMYALMQGLRSTYRDSEPQQIAILPRCLGNAPTLPFALDHETTKTIYQEIPYRWAEYFTWLRLVWGISAEKYDLRSALRSDYWKE